MRSDVAMHNRTSALRDVRERNWRRKERSPSATRSVIKLSRESSDCFAFERNRNVGCQDGTRSVRLRSIFSGRIGFGGFLSEGKPNK
jgi:hypothetical protein